MKRVEMSPRDQEIKAHIEKVMGMSLKAQKLYYHSYLLKGQQYSYVDILNDDERIVVVREQRQVYLGRNGLFTKVIRKSGLTFKKKGRAAARLTFWNGARLSDMYPHVRTLLEETKNEKGIDLFDGLISSNKYHVTKGLLSSIAAGKVESPEDMAYYIGTYCLPGVKLDKELRRGPLLEYLQATDNYHQAVRVLHTCADPNRLVRKFHPLNIMFDEEKNSRNKVIENLANPHFTKFLRLLEASNTKAYWEEVNIEKETKRLLYKTDSLVKLISLWTKGPTFVKDAGKKRYRQLGGSSAFAGAVDDPMPF